MSSKKLVKTSLTVATDILTSDKMEDPTVIDAEKPIKLTFNEDLDIKTVSKGIKLFKIKSDGEEVEEDIVITFEENSADTLYINKSSQSILSGEEYKLSINTQLSSLSGASLKKEFISYFTADYSFN